MIIFCSHTPSTILGYAIIDITKKVDWYPSNVLDIPFGVTCIVDDGQHVKGNSPIYAIKCRFAGLSVMIYGLSRI